VISLRTVLGTEMIVDHQPIMLVNHMLVLPHDIGEDMENECFYVTLSRKWMSDRRANNLSLFPSIIPSKKN
jgi:hypothetical protein